MTVYDTWVATLTAQTYPSTDQYLHTPFGFDPLGVLCEMFRHSTYTMPTGQGSVSVGLLQNISDARNAVSQALQDDGFPFPTHVTALADAIAASFWATDQIGEADKLLIKTWRDAIDAERSAFIQATLADPGSTPVQDALTAYQTTISLWEEWLATLTSPGGWRAFLMDWETAAWVLDTGRTFYTLNGIATKLPEAVQRWAELFEADPIVTLTGDSDYGTDVRLPLNLVVDGLVRKKVGATYRVYTEAEIIALIDAHAPVGVAISPLSPTINAVSTQQFTATVTHAQNTDVTWSCDGHGTIDQNGLYTPGGGIYTERVRATSVEDPSVSASTFVHESGVIPPGGPGGGGGGGN